MIKLRLHQANLELDGYYVRDLHCSVRPRADDAGDLRISRGLHIQLEKPIESGAYQLISNIEAASHDTDNSRFRVVLQLATKDDVPDVERQPNYRFDVTLVGFFRVVGVEVPAPTLVPPIVQNAVMLLYSTAREVIASATGRGPFPAMILPTLSFSVINEPAQLSQPNPKRLPSKTKAVKKTAKKK